MDMELADERTLLDLLAASLTYHLQSDQDVSLRFLFSAMKDAVVDSTLTDEAASLRLTTMVGESWRTALMAEVSKSEKCFTRAFVLISQELFHCPSDTRPISLLKLIAGQSSKENETISHSIPTGALTHAVTDILQFALEALSSRNDCVLVRLAPLLILRCLPYNFFRRTIHDADNPSRVFLDLVASVGNQLAIRLGIADDDRDVDPARFTREEKCLAAEIACCLLPLGGARLRDKEIDLLADVSFYRLIFYKAFRNISEVAGFVELDEHVLVARVKSGIAAVCLLSNVLQRAVWTDRGDVLLTASSMLFQVLASEKCRNTPLSEVAFRDLEDQIVEFFTSCKLTLMRFQREAYATSRMKQGVAELTGNSSCNALDAAREVWSVIQSAMETGKSTDRWIPLETTITAPTRLVMMRSFLLVCQRCEDTELVDFATNNLPWTVSFLAREPSTGFLTHELLLAAALQSIFVLVTRTKSLEGFGRCTKSRKHAVNELLHFVIEALKRIVFNQNGTPSTHPFRCATLTLFLSLLLVDSNRTEKSALICLKDSEMRAALELVRQVSTADLDDQVQLVAFRILGFFQESRPTHS